MTDSATASEAAIRLSEAEDLLRDIANSRGCGVYGGTTASRPSDWERVALPKSLRDRIQNFLSCLEERVK